MTLSAEDRTLPKKLFLNNKHVVSKNSTKLCVYNPADGSLIADDVPLANAEDIHLAVTYAKQAFHRGHWRAMPPSERRGILQRFGSLIKENLERLAYLTRISLGSPYEATGKGESLFGAEIFEYYAGWVDKYAGESYPAEDGFYKIVRHEPLGVCAGIIPWNSPLASICIKAAPALAMGNCFILKASEKTPFAALALGDLILKAGFPPGVFQVLSGDGTSGALIASHMQVKKVSFTGSVATGKKIQQAAAQSNMKRVTLELGGKSPAVVFDDCNLHNAMSWCANAIAANTGQVCFAASRVYVQKGIYPEFIAAYKAAIEGKAAKTGDPSDKAMEVGPLVDKSQFERVNGFIARAKKGNDGKLLTGGKRVGRKGYFLEPTVFTDSPFDSEIHKQEIFGPVAVVNTFETEQEILDKSNDTNFGLMSGVFTQDINRALRFSAQLDSGVVGINCVSTVSLSTPFGGTKESGIGRELGHFALRAYTEPKTILINMSHL
ncbi:MAG: hypothetical protein M1827_003435 [Pycnora praestabilis]|nr:MAG: hypothetical protein M1827_003435 [Pycnora praestabilis]